MLEARAKDQLTGVPLIMKDVTRRFVGGSEERTVLRNVSLIVEEKQLVAIVGPSGSGKTTLLRIAGTLDVPDEGEVRVVGRRLSATGEAELQRLRRHDLAFIFSESNLLDGLTVRENVELALEGLGLARIEIDGRVREAMRQMGVRDLADRFPHQLSAGEQQRVAMGRSLARRPRLLVCDEPTAHLDQDSAARLAGSLLDLCAAGSACLLATHDLEVARRAHRILRLRDSSLTTFSDSETGVSTPA